MIYNQSNLRLYEMANLSKIDSGLPNDIWIDSQGKDRVTGHSTPRIKVKVSSGNLVPVSISKDPKILIDCDKKDQSEVKKVIPFLRSAYEILIKHWNHQYTDYQALGQLIKLAKSNSY